MTIVYLRVTRAPSSPWLVGCGAYGCGDGVSKATRVARREVRQAFGPDVETETVRIEEQAELGL